MKAPAEVKVLPQTESRVGVRAAGRARIADYVALTKPRISVTVLFTTLAGYYMASSAPLDFAKLIHALLGTALVAGGANVINQVIERDRDALMHRTLDRPIPAGRLSVAESLAFGLVLFAVGVIYLIALTTLMAGALAALTFLLYTLVYTPLKPATTMNTAIGAVPGALPPLIGWAAARGDINMAALSIFGVLYLWQIPHFLAIAWIYREDYARGGFKMLPVVDPSGSSTARHILFQGLALIIVSLLPTSLGLTGAVYFFSALALGLAFWGFGWIAAFRKSDANARRLFLVSVIYLMVLFTIMMIDKR